MTRLVPSAADVELLSVSIDGFCRRRWSDVAGTSRLACMRISQFSIAALAGLLVAATPATTMAASDPALVVVTAASTGEAVDALEAFGVQTVGLVPSARSVIAHLEEDQIARLKTRGLIVTPDREIAPTSGNFDPVARDIQLDAMAPATDWSLDAGAGVGVALIDTGVADVSDLAGRVVDGPDLSDEEDGLDAFGHGTFMAGLIAGDGASTAASGGPRRTGLAPSAHIVNVKVAGADGSTSLVRLLTALDWVIAHRAEFAIEVVNLSFAADPAGSWQQDPLALAATYAVESGLTVVAASGNDGGRTGSPAYAPGVTAVGALDHAGSVPRSDDRRASWSAQTPAIDKPELLAPGVSTISLRAPGSTIDRLNPQARVDAAYFRGSGTSMATALTSAAAAVLAASYPDAPASAVRRALILTADKIPSSVGAAVDLAGAASSTTASSTGLGRPIDVGTVVIVTDAAWNGTWNGTRWAGTRWAGTRWAGTRWAGISWAEAELAGTRWAGTRWAGTRWAGTDWTIGS